MSLMNFHFSSCRFSAPDDCYARWTTSSAVFHLSFMFSRYSSSFPPFTIFTHFFPFIFYDSSIFYRFSASDDCYIHIYICLPAFSVIPGLFRFRISHPVLSISLSYDISISLRAGSLHQMTATEADDMGHVTVNIGSQDLFQMQHHHLLNCLEHTTVSLKLWRLPRIEFCYIFLFFHSFLLAYRKQFNGQSARSRNQLQRFKKRLKTLVFQLDCDAA